MKLPSCLAANQEGGYVDPVVECRNSCSNSAMPGFGSSLPTWSSLKEVDGSGASKELEADLVAISGCD